MARGDRRLRTRLSDALPGRSTPDRRLERAMQAGQDEQQRLAEALEARQADEVEAVGALERATEVRDDLAAKVAAADRAAEDATARGDLVRSGEAMAAAGSFTAQLEAVERDVATVSGALAVVADARAEAAAALEAHERLLRGQLDELRGLVADAEAAEQAEPAPPTEAIEGEPTKDPS